LAAPPRTLLWELTTLSRHLAGKEGWLPPPQEPHPLSAFQASGIGLSGLACSRHLIFKPLRSKILPTALTPLYPIMIMDNLHCPE